ncbi:MAG: 4a-hydroxytetrahydrobiopterin dehydratase [Candidatus Carbobacillus sp.]|nr:4a-hydroxytetrahydrobiopterin dehydratase [Candidatus Carbobacillus sp.]
MESKRLSEDEIITALRKLQHWKRTEDGRWIERRYHFKTFMQAIDFVQKIAEIAEENMHHPLIQIDYKVVTLKLSSWQAGGLTNLDIEEAHRFDAVYERMRQAAET